MRSDTIIWKICIIAALGLLGLVGLVGTGCADLERQAGVHDSVAESIERGADAVVMFDGTAEEALAWVSHPGNAPAIALLPEAWQARIWAAVQTGGDVRPVLAQGASEARMAAAEQRAIAEDLRAKAAQNRGKFLNILDSGTAILVSLLTGTGILTTIAGSVIGKRKGRLAGAVDGLQEGARQVAEIINAGRHADPNGFELAVKSGPAHDAMQKALDEANPLVAATVIATKL